MAAASNGRPPYVDGDDAAARARWDAATDEERPDPSVPAVVPGRLEPAEVAPGWFGVCLRERWWQFESERARAAGWFPDLCEGSSLLRLCFASAVAMAPGLDGRTDLRDIQRWLASSSIKDAPAAWHEAVSELDVVMAVLPRMLYGTNERPSREAQNLLHVAHYDFGGEQAFEEWVEQDLSATQAELLRALVRSPYRADWLHEVPPDVAPHPGWGEPYQETLRNQRERQGSNGTEVALEVNRFLPIALARAVGRVALQEVDRDDVQHDEDRRRWRWRLDPVRDGDGRHDDTSLAVHTALFELTGELLLAAVAAVEAADGSAAEAFASEEFVTRCAQVLGRWYDQAEEDPAAAIEGWTLSDDDHHLNIGYRLLMRDARRRLVRAD